MTHATPDQRSRTPWAALAVGVLLGSGVLALIHAGPFRETTARRYVSHPVECVEVILFSCAVAAFGGKLLRARAERRALRRGPLPPWDGRPVPVAEAAGLSAELAAAPKGLRQTVVARRVTAVLHFLTSRGSAAQLDDQLRALGDDDALALEASYGLTRFITWAIPILGFLGTVLGITGAIAGVTPEVLEQSLSGVTDGLALAFDATALGLALTMAAMFLNYLVERAEWGALEAVDRYVDRELAHRFERAAEAGPAGVNGLAGAFEPLLRRQAEIWAEAQAEADRRRADAEARLEQRLSSALAAALEQTLEAHARRLTALEKQAVESGSGAVERIAEHARAVCEAGKDQQAALARLVQGVAAQVQALGRIQAGAEQLVRLQDALNQNLSALAAAGTFDQAVHSLTAAIHLLTTRAEATRPRAAA
jgi:biopolymer transport protein ExbB/TolQ